MVNARSASEIRRLPRRASDWRLFRCPYPDSMTGKSLAFAPNLRARVVRGNICSGRIPEFFARVGTGMIAQIAFMRRVARQYSSLQEIWTAGWRGGEPHTKATPTSARYRFTLRHSSMQPKQALLLLRFPSQTFLQL